jgi:hypothetical protein
VAVDIVGGIIVHELVPRSSQMASQVAIPSIEARA